MELSERRRAANACNSKKSTGPRTAEGKARSCSNARRHGLAAGARTPSQRRVISQLAAYAAQSPLMSSSTFEAVMAIANAEADALEARAERSKAMAGLRDADEATV